MNDLHDQLAAPFAIGELKFFPVALTQDRKKGRVGSYIDARSVMNRLDAVVGPNGWGTTYRCIDPADKVVECTLSVFTEGAWVAKADVGYPNDAKDADNPDKEAWKAAYSDSLKRAAVQWGIGRYIYDLELAQDWLPVDQNGRFTEQPRLKGQPQQAHAPEGASRSTGASPAAAPPARKAPTWEEWAQKMGYTLEYVTSVSQEMFGNREMKQLSADEKRRLAVELEDRKKKVPA